MSPDRVAPFDLAAALERMGGDEDLLREVVRLFIDDFPAQMAAIGSAVADRDTGRLIYAAHALKGAAATLSATGVEDASETLESIGRDGPADAMDDAWVVLQAEGARLIDRLRPLFDTR